MYIYVFICIYIYKWGCGSTLDVDGCWSRCPGLAKSSGSVLSAADLLLCLVAPEQLFGCIGTFTKDLLAQRWPMSCHYTADLLCSLLTFFQRFFR